MTVKLHSQADLRRELALRRSRRRRTQGGFSFCGFGGAAAGGFQRADLPLTIFQVAAFSSVPWAGSASQGGSAGNRVGSVSVNNPSVGASLGGLASADFDGTNDEADLETSGGTNLTGSQVVSAAAGSIWVVLNLDSIGTNQPTANLNDCALMDTLSGFGIYFRTGLAGFFITDSGGIKSTTQSFTTSAWHLIQAKWDSSNISLRVDSATRTTTPAGAISTTLAGSNVRVGRNGSTGSEYMDGRVREIGMMQSALSNGDEDAVKADINTFYGTAF